MPPVRKIKSGYKKSAAVPIETSNKDAVISGQLDKKIKKQNKKQPARKHGVIFVKHLPHGFFEEQLKKYFQQFGDVTRLRLARSKRTGGSKGYAFVEFEYPDVAQVAAETMNNYLMFKKVVKASYIPPENQRFNYFKSSLRKVKNKAGKEIFVSSKSAATQRKVKEHNNWSEEIYQKRTLKNLNKIKKLNQKYGHLGIDFSSVIVGPKKLSISDKDKMQDTDEQILIADTTKQKTKVNRKSPTEVVAAAQKQKSQKKLKMEVELQDLLGNTINDDSEDDDYIVMSDEYDEDTTSDEETYGIINQSDEEDVGTDLNEANIAKKLAFGKSVKKIKVDRFEQVIKRKPHLGGIQKSNQKNFKKPVNKLKSSVQIAAAKEIANPLKNLKGKGIFKEKVAMKLVKK